MPIINEFALRVSVESTIEEEAPNDDDISSGVIHRTVLNSTMDPIEAEFSVQDCTLALVILSRFFANVMLGIVEIDDEHDGGEDSGSRPSSPKFEILDSPGSNCPTITSPKFTSVLSATVQIKGINARVVNNTLGIPLFSISTKASGMLSKSGKTLKGRLMQTLKPGTSIC